MAYTFIWKAVTMCEKIQAIILEEERTHGDTGKANTTTQSRKDSFQLSTVQTSDQQKHD